MAEWWESAPLAQPSGNWWEAAPLAQPDPATPPTGGGTFLGMKLPTMDEARAFVGQQLKPGGALSVDDLIRSVASGATFNFADELAAMGNAAIGKGDYTSNVAAERERDKQINPVVGIPGQVAGGVMTGTGLGRAGVTMLNAARPTYGSMMARGAGEGAAYGAAYGAGAGEGERDRAEKALYGAGIGAAGGAASGAVGARMAQRGMQGSIPTTQQLRQQANDAYRAADQAGVVIAQNSLQNEVQGIQRMLANEGIDATLHPRAMAAFNRLQEAAQQGNVTLEGAEILRRVLRAAGASNDAGERRLVQMMTERLDDFVGRLSPNDVVMGNAQAGSEALAQARNLWSRMRKSETIENLVDRAQLRASQFSGSGYENALRTEFRNLAMNERRMRGFNDAEQEAIRRVAQGGSMENILRAVGKMAPTGVVSSVLSGGAGAAASQAAGLPGAVGAIALPAVGMAARQGATAMTNRNAQAAGELMRAGGALPQLPPLTPAQIALIRSLMLPGAQQGGALQGRMPFSMGQPLRTPAGG